MTSSRQIPGYQSQRTDGSELAANVKNHDNRHEKGHNVHSAGGALEDDGVCELDIAGIAVRLDTDAARHFGDGADGCAQWQWRHVANVGEVAEARHVGLSGRGTATTTPTTVLNAS